MYLSIVVPTFNSALTVGKMIESYVAENFSFESELIFIDNESKDQTIEIIEHFRKSNNTIKLISEKDRGISDAFNKGINHANGEYILILGSDDYLISGWSQEIEGIIDLNFDVISYAAIHQNKSFQTIHIPPKNIEDIRKQMCIPHTSTLVRSALFERVRFSEDYSLAMDYDFFLRVYLQGASYTFCERPLTIVGTQGISHMNYFRSLLECHKIQKDNKIMFSSFYLFWNVLKFNFRRTLEIAGLSSVVDVYRKHISINRKNVLK